MHTPVQLYTSVPVQVQMYTCTAVQFTTQSVPALAVPYLGPPRQRFRRYYTCADVTSVFVLTWCAPACRLHFAFLARVDMVRACLHLAFLERADMVRAALCLSRTS